MRGGFLVIFPTRDGLMSHIVDLRGADNLGNSPIDGRRLVIQTFVG